MAVDQQPPERLALPGVKVIKKVLASGQIKWHYRHRATGTMLGSSEDHEAVRIAHAALHQRNAAAPVPPIPSAGTTFGQLIDDYYASSRYLERCAESSQRYHAEHLEALRNVFGGQQLEAITAECVERYLGTLKATPTTRFKRLKEMRLILGFAVGREKYGLKYNVAGQVFVEKPAARSVRWTLDQRARMYAGLPGAERAPMYRSLGQRKYQKDQLRDALRRIGAIGRGQSRFDYNMSIEELDGFYRSSCAERGIQPERIYDGLSLAERARSYAPESFSADERERADLRAGYMRMASLMAYYLGQRRGDLVDITRSRKIELANGEPNDSYLFQAHDRRGRQWVFARIAQNKSRGKTVVEVPLHPKLESALRQHVWRGDYILSAPEGGHWEEHRFSHYWREECEILGIEEVTLHDTRRTIRTDLSEAGCTDEEISCILGHNISTLTGNDMADVYTVRNREMAINALEKLMAWEKRVEEQQRRREVMGLTMQDTGEVDFLVEPKKLAALRKKSATA